jgi:hypothetical protein
MTKHSGIASLPARWRKVAALLEKDTEMQIVLHYAKAMRRCAKDLTRELKAARDRPSPMNASEHDWHG